MATIILHVLGNGGGSSVQVKQLSYDVFYYYTDVFWP
jgi:hypothetical protein